MTSAGAFRLVIGLVLTVGALLVLFSRLEPIFDGPPALMTALLVTAAAGLVLIASAFWTLGRPPDLPTGQSRPPAPSTGHPGRILGRAVVAGLAIAVIVALAWLRP